MQKSFRSTLILLGVFVLLIAWYQIYEKRIKPGRTEAEEKTKSVVTLDSKEIVEIDVERMKNAPPESADSSVPMPDKPEYETIKLKKTGEDWNIVAPVQASADNGTVNTNVTTLATTKHERVVDEKPSDYAQYGLKDPVLRITARTSGGAKTETVLVGRNTPTGFSSYLQIADKPIVYRVTRTLRTSFDKDVKNIRNKSILNVARADVGEVEIQLKKENIILKKDDKIKDREEWMLARDNIPADTTEWQKTLNAIVDMKAVEFPSEDGKDLQQFGLASPTARIWLVQAKDKGKVGLLVGSAKDKVYAKREDKPVVYEVDKELLKKIERPGSEYRSQRLANYNRFDVKRVKLERGTDVIELLKDEKGWSLPTNPGFKVDAAKVDTFLTAIQDGKITKYLVGSPKPTEPQLVIRLYEKKDNTEKERVSLKFGKPQGAQVLVERSELDVPFLLPLDEFKKLSLQQKDFELVEKKAPENPAGKTEDKKDDKATPAKQG